MSDLIKVLKTYRSLQHTTQLALVTVLEVVGSSFRRPGAMMLVEADSKWHGAISGGCLEGDALKRARNALLNNQPSLITYDTVNDEDEALGPRIGCNGIVTVLVEPLQKHCWLSKIKNEDVKSGGYLATVVQGTDAIEVKHALLQQNGDELYSEMPSGYFHKFKLEDLANVEYQRETEKELIFVQKLEQQKRLLICGAGNHILPLIHQAKITNWEVILTDNCVAHASPALFPEADKVIMAEANEVGNLLGNIGFEAAVIVAHEPNYVNDSLLSLLKKDPPYIGLIGNRIRIKGILTELFLDDIPETIHAPVGLNLGGNSPEEMALSIVAELQSHYYKVNARALKDQNGLIHPRFEQERSRDISMLANK